MISEADLAALRPVFQAEADDLLAEMERALELLRAQPGHPDAVQVLFRVVHTLKGAGASLGFTGLAAFAHRVEDLLDRVRSRTLLATAAVIDVLQAAADVLRGLANAALVPGRPEPRALPDAISRIEQLLGGGVEPPREAAPAAELSSAPASTSLRVGIEKLDGMLNLTGEIFIARGKLAALLEAGAPHEALRDAHDDSDRLYRELQQVVLQARMVPLGPTLRRQARLVREVAALCGKQARLEIEGEHVEMDTAFVEALSAPLAHLIRNAIDHGLELPDQRRARGKALEGTIRLRARHDGATVAVEVSDDGAGLDQTALLERGRQLGLVEGGELRPGEVERLVFEPGLSTARQVTGISGRGVGMDVVRRNIEALRGTVEVESVAGQGCSFAIRLPLTLAIIQGLAVRVGEESFVIPIDAVRECVELPRGADPAALSGILNLRDRVLPYLRLRSQFAIRGPLPKREQVVVVRNGADFAGLAVDELEGEVHSVIKPLGKLFEGLPGISASTIRADGRVALILDVPGLLRRALARSTQSDHPLRTTA